MRQTRKSQLALGEARIEDIKLDHKSRDDIPAVLLGLQHLYSHEETREKLFSLLEGPGGRGQLPTRGSHGSGRAPFGHPAPQIMVSLLNGTHCARRAQGGGDRC